ncbi:unnamed protein product, partial [Bubo scandiacus]
MGNAATAKKGNEIESGEAKGEKVKCECIVEFSKTRCEDELDVMKPTEILCEEARLYHRDNNLLLVLQFPQSC